MTDIEKKKGVVQQLSDVFDVRDKVEEQVLKNAKKAVDKTNIKHSMIENEEQLRVIDGVLSADAASKQSDDKNDVDQDDGNENGQVKPSEQIKADEESSSSEYEDVEEEGEEEQEEMKEGEEPNQDGEQQPKKK